MSNERNCKEKTEYEYLLDKEKQEYQIYLDCADDGNGLDITTGKPLKTYDEWLNS